MDYIKIFPILLHVSISLKETCLWTSLILSRSEYALSVRQLGKCGEFHIQMWSTHCVPIWILNTFYQDSVADIQESHSGNEALTGRKWDERKLKIEPHHDTPYSFGGRATSRCHWLSRNSKWPGSLGMEQLLKCLLKILGSLGKCFEVYVKLCHILFCLLGSSSLHFMVAF